jgi:hypothetical protein
VDDEATPIEVEEPGLDDGEGVDAWVENFTAPELPGYVRLDSRRWLVLPERYVYKPLAALDAAREVDKLVTAPGGKALVSLALGLRRVREGLLAAYGTDEGGLAEIDVRMIDFAEDGFEVFCGAIEGSSFSLHEWALGWIQRCGLRRVPLPASSDVGGLVATAKGPASWSEFYAGRYVLLYRLAAACAWGSLGPFFASRREPAT